MSFKEITLRIRPPPHSWVIELLQYYPAKVEILDCKPVSEEKVNEIFEIKCNPKHVREIEEVLKKSQYIDYFEIFTIDAQKGRIYGTLRTSHCSVCRLFAKSSECFLGSAIYDVEEKYVKWSLIANMTLVEEIIKRLSENGVEVHIDKITKIISEDDKSPALTLNQEKILRLAWKLGFFDFPRKLTLQDLSRVLNLSPATVSECLRTGLRKMLSSYFEEKR
jgi:hypothetical protein